MASGPPNVEMTASGAISKQPGSQPTYPTPSVTLHVPYTSSHNQMVASAVPSRAPAQNVQMVQQSNVIQKATSSNIPGKNPFI